MANIGKRWTENDENEMLSKIKTESITSIAKLIGRTEGAVRSRLLQIGVNMLNTGVAISSVIETINCSQSELEHYMTNRMSNADGSNTIYAVAVGEKTGIFKTWEEVEPLVKNFKNSTFKRFNSIKGAEEYLLKYGSVKPNVESVTYSLTDEQKSAISVIKNGDNLFLTGPAGTGKSFVINAIINYAKESYKNYAVTGLTGCAASIIFGKTIHSYLGIGIGNKQVDELVDNCKKRNRLRYEELRTLELLIIDEISMMDVQLIELIDNFLKAVKYNSLPWGGIQVVFCGDLYQLPPVKGEFCFKSPIWEALNIKTVTLTKLIRQDGDTVLQNMLSRFRIGICLESDLETLNMCKKTRFGPSIIPTKIYSKNSSVDEINTKMYETLVKAGCQVKQFKRVCKGGVTSTQWANAIGVPELLNLCVGAQVLVTTNISDSIYNGLRGCITDLYNDTVTIVTNDDQVIDIKQFTIMDTDNHISVSYIPLKLAFAITVHKSQGMTLDAIEIDLGEDIFEAGQAYVAISRARCLSSIKIKHVCKKSFIASKKVTEFYNSIN